MELIKRYSNCFVCGDRNESGLKVDFFYDQGMFTSCSLEGKITCLLKVLPMLVDTSVTDVG